MKNGPPLFGGGPPHLPEVGSERITACAQERCAFRGDRMKRRSPYLAEPANSIGDDGTEPFDTAVVDSAHDGLSDRSVLTN